jgi:cytochrome P450
MTRVSARRIAWQDMRVNLAAHPFAWPAARALRNLGAAVRVPGVGVVVNSALLAHDVLSQDRTFVKQGPGSIADAFTRAFGPSALANMDGQAHRDLRQRLGPLASASQADSWLASARAPFERAVHAISRGKTVDLARTSRELSGRLTLTMMGAIPERVAPKDEAGIDHAARDVHALGERIASSLQLNDLSKPISPNVQADLARLLAYANDAFARDDLPPASLVARLKALGCDAVETRGILSIFFVAGALTLGVALPRIAALLIESGQLTSVRDDPAAIVRAVDEGLRYTCPVPATMRIAASDETVGPIRVRKGERLLILTANLSRDPELFPNPDTFDVTRQHDARARYLWYGAGPHFCLGFTLAQRTLQYAVGALAAVPGSLRVVRRRSARGVLLPAWLELHVARRTS